MVPPTVKGGSASRPRAQPQTSRLRDVFSRSLNSPLVEEEVVASDQDRLDLAYSIYLGACTTNFITRELEALQDMYSAEELKQFLGETELEGIVQDVTNVQLPAMEERKNLEKVLKVAKFLKPCYVEMAQVFRSKKYPTLETFKTALEKEFGNILLEKGGKPCIMKSPVFQKEEEMDKVIRHLEKEFLENENEEDKRAAFKNIAKFSQVFIETLEKMRKLSKESSVPSENEFLELASQLATSKAVERAEKKRNKKKKRKAQSNNQAEGRNFGVDYKELEEVKN